jgi:hypothetical protein
MNEMAFSAGVVLALLLTSAAGETIVYRLRRSSWLSRLLSRLRRRSSPSGARAPSWLRRSTGPRPPSLGKLRVTKSRSTEWKNGG